MYLNIYIYIYIRIYMYIVSVSRALSISIAIDLSIYTEERGRATHLRYPEQLGAVSMPRRVTPPLTRN